MSRYSTEYTDPPTIKDYSAIAKKYAQGVVEGKVIACAWVKKACQRQLDDLKKAKDRKFPYRFDEVKANRICAFAEGLPHIKGEWANRGEKLTLEPWQIFIYTTVFGWVNKRTNLRRYRTIYIECARKNGKSSLSAPVGIYTMSADDESGAEVYSAATSRDQAKIVWEVSKSMVEREPELRNALGVDTSAHAIYQQTSASRFQALSAEGNSLDGLNVHCAIIDELHAHRTRKVYDVIETAKAARQQPVLWLITTAGSDQTGICYEQRTYVTKILDGAVADDSYFGIIYTIDEDDNWQDEKVWVKANPNLDVSVDREELQRLAQKAASMPSALNNFLTKHLSVWVNADVALFDPTKWAKLGNSDLKLSDFEGKPCWIGIDLAPRHDFSAKVLLFKRDDEYFVFPSHYLSEEEAAESENSSYSGWVRDGWITANPGQVTDYAALEEEIDSDISHFEIREVCYDPFSAHQFATRMQEKNVPMVEVRPIVVNFSEATKKLDALIAEGKIHHNADPILTWEISNVVGHYDRKSNVFPTKERPENKIDGAISLIMALSRAMTEEGPQPSIYDKPEEVWL